MKKNLFKENFEPGRDDNILILREARKIIEGFGKMLAPFCEIVLYDLSQKESAVVAIECPISDREVGHPISDVGLARIKDPSFPDILQNYATSFRDGRPAKSTSIGLRNSSGEFIAAICIKFDLSALTPLKTSLNQFLNFESVPHLDEFRSRSMSDIRSACEFFAAKRNKIPKSLNQTDRLELIRQLNENGILKFQKGSVKLLADCLGISREYIYKILRTMNDNTEGR